MCQQTLSPKGFKISLISDVTHRKGICCKSIQELKEKACKRFSVSYSKSFRIYTEDGTEVDDDEFLLQLVPQTLLFIGDKKSKKHNQTSENIFDHLLSLIRWSGGMEPVYKEVLDFLQDDFQSKWTQMKKGLKIVEKSDLTLKSNRDDHPSWFEDLSTNAKTKEEVMFKSCQARIRGYIAKAETQLREDRTLHQTEQRLIEELISEMKTKLKEDKFFGDYFCRTAEEKKRICDRSGIFNCEGKYNAPCCLYSEHFINPYSSPESRILFSTWNLDHLIERSRSIVPSLLEAIKRRKGKRKINLDYFYTLLFTRSNLKLVHIVCHDKGSHQSMNCDKKQYYIN